MALIKCPECGKEISDKATSCPNCGCPIAAAKSELIIHVNDKNLGAKRTEMFYFYVGDKLLTEIPPGQTKTFKVNQKFSIVCGHKRGNFVGSMIKDSLPVEVIPGKVTKLVAELSAWTIPMRYVLSEVDMFNSI